MGHESGEPARMSDDAPDIPPALTEQEWGAEVRSVMSGKGPMLVSIPGALVFSNGPYELPVASFRNANDIAAIIALANEQLRQFDDPRAFTHDVVKLLREVADAYEHDTAGLGDDRFSRVHEFADALESMLPPESLTNAASD